MKTYSRAQLEKAFPGPPNLTSFDVLTIHLDRIATALEVSAGLKKLVPADAPKAQAMQGTVAAATLKPPQKLKKADAPPPAIEPEPQSADQGNDTPGTDY